MRTYTAEVTAVDRAGCREQSGHEDRQEGEELHLDFGWGLMKEGPWVVGREGAEVGRGALEI